MHRTKQEWSKTFPITHRDNLISHARLKAPRFEVSYEKEPCPVSMSWILGGEYARIWLHERDAYQAKLRSKSTPKIIKNSFKWWLDKRK